MILEAYCRYIFWGGSKRYYAGEVMSPPQKIELNAGKKGKEGQSIDKGKRSRNSCVLLSGYKPNLRPQELACAEN